MRCWRLPWCARGGAEAKSKSHTRTPIAMELWDYLPDADPIWRRSGQASGRVRRRTVTESSDRATRHPRAPLALCPFQFRARLLATAHEGLVPLVITEDTLALDTRLEPTEQAVERLAGARCYLHLLHPPLGDASRRRPFGPGRHSTRPYVQCQSDTTSCHSFITRLLTGSPATLEYQHVVPRTSATYNILCLGPEYARVEAVALLGLSGWTRVKHVFYYQGAGSDRPGR